jgi:glucosamine--fructose-6-phosphate aminotransferase (isomerizing)
LIVVRDEEALLNQARIALCLPVKMHEWLSPITSIIPGQLFAMHLVNAHGLDVS